MSRYCPPFLRPMVTLLALCSAGQAFSGHWTAFAGEDPLMRAIAYFEWMSVKPNQFKREEDGLVQRLGQAAFRRASDPRVIAFLHHSLESLANDPECRPCQIPLIAAQSGDVELMARAAAALRERAPPSLTVLLNEWTEFARLFPESEERRSLIRIMGRLLSKSGTPWKTHETELKELLSRPYRGGMDVEIAHAYLTEAEGPAFAATFTEQARDEKLRLALSRLRNRGPDQHSSSLHEELVRVLMAPADPEAASLLGPLLARWDWIDNPYLLASALLAAFSGPSPAARDAALQKGQELLDQLSAGNLLDLIGPYFSHEEEMRDYPGRLIERQRTADHQNPSILLYRLLEQAQQHLQSILPPEPCLEARLAEAATAFILRLKQDKAALQTFAEARLYSGDPRSQFAEKILAQLIGPDALRQSRARWNEREFTLALGYLKSSSGLQIGQFDARPLVRIFLENRFRPEVLAVLRERIPAILPDCSARWGDTPYLLLMHVLGDASLKKEVETQFALSFLETASTEGGCPFPPTQLVFMTESLRGLMAREDFAPLAESAIKILLTAASLSLDANLLLGALEENFLQSAPPPPEDSLLSQVIARFRGTEHLRTLLGKARERNENAAFSSTQDTLLPTHRWLSELITHANSASGPAPAHLVKQLFRHAYDDGIAALLGKALAPGAPPLPPTVDRAVLLAAALSNKPTLQAAVRARLDSRVRGQDPDFEESLGRSPSTPVERLAFLIRHMAAQKGAETLLPDLLLSLPLERPVLQEALSLIAAGKYQPAAVRAAQETLNRFPLPGSVGPTSRAKRRQSFVFINGGYSPSSDFPDHETGMREFNNLLFTGEGVLFSGGGPGSRHLPIAPNWPGTDIEPLVPQPRQPVKDWKIEKASSENISRFFQGLAKTPPDELTVIYLSHGNQYGIALWDMGMVSADTMARYYDGFPSTTTVRSLVSTCHAGAAVLPPVRHLPRAKKKLSAFLELYYPPNRCALATSSEDETGFYFGTLGSYEGGTFLESLISSEPNISLWGLHERLLDRSEVMSTPVLTSDYFARDLVGIVCGTPAAFASDTKLNLEDICRELQSDPVHERTRALQEFSRTLADPFDRDFARLTWKLIKKYFPEIPRDSIADAEKLDIEALHQDYLQRGKDRDYGLSPKNLTSLLRLLGTGQVYELVAQLALAASPVFRADFDGWFEEYMGDPRRKAAYAPFLGTDARSGTYKAAIMSETLMHHAFSLQSQRKSLAGPYRAKLRKTARLLLNELPLLRPESARYGSIVACEKSALRGL